MQPAQYLRFLRPLPLLSRNIAFIGTDLLLVVCTRGDVVLVEFVSLMPDCHLDWAIFSSPCWSLKLDTCLALTEKFEYSL